MSFAEKMTPSAKRPLVRDWFPWIVLALALLGLAIVWSIPLGTFDRERRILVSLCGLPVIFLLLAIWLVGWSGYSWRRRVGLLLLSVVIIVGGVSACIRGVQFSGDAFPMVQFRWDGDRDARLEAHRRHQSVAAAPAAIAPSRAEAAEFPGYRGRQRDGIVHGPALAR